MLKKGQTYLKMLRCGCRKSFKVCLVIFRHYTEKVKPVTAIENAFIFSNTTHTIKFICTSKERIRFKSWLKNWY